MMIIPELPLRTFSKYAYRFLSTSPYSNLQCSHSLVQLSLCRGHLASVLIIKEELPELVKLFFCILVHKTQIPADSSPRKPQHLR